MDGDDIGMSSWSSLKYFLDPPLIDYDLKDSDSLSPDKLIRIRNTDNVP